MNWASTLKGIWVPALIIIVWEAVVRFGFVNPQILPSPSAVVIRWYHYLLPTEAYDPQVSSYAGWMFSGELIRDLISSFYRVAVGFLIGAGLALPLGLLMGGSTHIYDYMNPLIQVLRPIPPIAFIPLAILWFGLGDPPAVFLIALGAFFPVLMNTIVGVRAVDNIYVRAARNLGASRTQMFIKIILPAAMPYILSGVRIGIGTGFICMIVAEMIAVNNGLGYRILEAREYFWSDKIIAGMFSIGLLGLAIDTGVSRLNNYLLRWHRGLE
ncbi:ABC transporter permease [Bdellovibrio sp. 22V]|uniref:ABC transporter permease n=1 Tax=Bdellovibrio sp. 22V TaxID=3044166 RepID=UPI0025436F51|nr:ABC transporter permease [Bdellovibrio sp. 22V]WII73959.1 ABC transporter permease [Bdellovibrio sp. 22V]